MANVESAAAGLRADQDRHVPRLPFFYAYPGFADLEVDLGTVAYRHSNLDPFEQYAVGALARLHSPRRIFEIGTYDGAYAGAVFGRKPVRRLGPQDIARFNQHLGEIRVRRPDGNDGHRDEPLSASTRAKHLRVLGACLNSAISHKYAAANPVKDLPPSEKARPARKESAFFADEELPRLFAEVTPGVFRTLFLTALKTGMREGELTGLAWADVDLTAAVARVRRTCTDGHVHEPKNHERRDVDLTPEVVAMLGGWWGELGSPADDQLVFPGDGRDGYLVNGTILKRELYPAMERAGVPRVGPTGEERTFHSFRHSFARIALEHGAELTWLSRHLGHSSTAVTDKVYGHWSRAARKRAMERLADAFTV